MGLCALACPRACATAVPCLGRARAYTCAGALRLWHVAGAKLASQARAKSASVRVCARVRVLLDVTCRLGQVCVCASLPSPCHSVGVCVLHARVRACVFVCVGARACAHACLCVLRARVRACVFVCVWARARACVASSPSSMCTAPSALPKKTQLCTAGRHDRSRCSPCTPPPPPAPRPRLLHLVGQQPMELAGLLAQ